MSIKHTSNEILLFPATSAKQQSINKSKNTSQPISNTLQNNPSHESASVKPNRLAGVAKTVSSERSQAIDLTHIKTALKDGTFNIDTAKIAEAVLKHNADLFKAK